MLERSGVSDEIVIGILEERTHRGRSVLLFAYPRAGFPVAEACVYEGNRIRWHVPVSREPFQRTQ